MYIVLRMKKLLPLLVIPLVAATCRAPEKPVRWTLVGNDTRSVAAGENVDIALEAEIADGWHIYSLTQKPGGPIPLSIQLVGAADVEVRGAIKAPKPVTKFDKAFGFETELHSGKARFNVPVGVPAGSLTGKRELEVAARYQACSDTICLSPRTEKLGVTLRITAASR